MHPPDLLISGPHFEDNYKLVQDDMAPPVNDGVGSGTYTGNFLFHSYKLRHLVTQPCVSPFLQRGVPVCLLGDKVFKGVLLSKWQSRK